MPRRFFRSSRDRRSAPHAKGAFRRKPLPLSLELLESRLAPASLAPALTAIGLPLTPTPGGSLSGPVAAFNDTNPGPYTANISWGDNTTSAGTIGQVQVNLYSQFTQGGNGTPFSNLVSSFNSPNIQFGASQGNFNWHPNGLSGFGVDFLGYVYVATTGSYTFTVASDDGSDLYIDGNTVVSDEGFHGAGNVTGSTSLTAGIHAFEIKYFENGGGGSGIDVTLPAGVSYANTVIGTHNYANIGNYTTSTAIGDTSGGSTTVTGTASSSNATPVAPLEGTSSGGLVASFVDAGANGPYGANINWGDGGSSAGTVYPVSVQLYAGFTGNALAGAPYSQPLGSFGANAVQFGASQNNFNWHPFSSVQRANLGTNWAADFTGSLIVASTGTYSFSLNSDDGSVLYIDNNLVVNDGGGHGPNLVSGSTTLTAGVHVFEVQFMETGGGQSGVDLTLPSGVTYATGNGPGTYYVFGTHTYQAVANNTVTTTITDKNNNSTTATSTAAVVNLPPTPVITGLPTTPVVLYPVNNGFELPNKGSGGGAYAYSTWNNPGATWTFTGNTGIAANGSAFGVQNATDGNHGGTTSTSGQAGFIQFGNGTTTGSAISQAITGFADGTASVTFSIERRSNGGGNNPIDVRLDGLDLGTYSATSTTSFNTVTTPAVNITAGSHTLYFIGTDPQGGDNTEFIDNVSVTNNVASAPQGTAITLGSSVTDPGSADQTAGFSQSWTAIQNAAGSALQLNGNGGYAITPNLASSFPSSDVTLQLWFRPVGPGVLVDELGQTALNNDWHDSQLEVLPSGQVMARVWSLTPVSLGFVTLGSAANWHSVTLRYNSATKTLDGFLDGVKAAVPTVGTPRSTPPASGYGQFYAVGATDGQNLGGGASFNGQVDEFRVWNVALSDSQVASNTNQRLTGTEAHLVAYYRFDDGAGTVMTDSGPNHLNGTIIPPPLALAPGGPGVPGSAASAYQFNGFNGGQVAVNVPQLNTATGTANTVSFWMNWNGNDSAMPVGFTTYDLWLAGGSAGAFGFNTGQGDIWGISSFGLIDQWHYVTAVFQNGNATQSQLWIDGVQQTLTQQFGTTSTSRTIGSTEARISGWTNDNNYRFGGSLADVSFFAGQLSAASIQAQYNSVAAGTFLATIAGQGPAAFYQLNEAPGSTVAVDSSGHGNNSSPFGPSQLWVASTAPIGPVVASGSTQSPTSQSFPFTFTPHDDGLYTVTLTAADQEGASATTYANLLVTGGIVGPSVTAPSLSATEGTALTNVQVATFTQNDGSTSDGPHTATIYWGDGTSSVGTVVEPTANSPGTVAGSHTYAGAGSDTISVTVTDSEGVSGTGSATATVSDAAVVASGVAVSGAEGLPAATTGQAAVAYGVAAGTAGNQDYGGSLGFDFNVNTPITVTQLGVFDDGSDGLSVPITARLYNRDTQAVLATIVFAAGSNPATSGTLVGGSRFLSLATPISLPAGFHGTIEADGYSRTELNGNISFNPLPLSTNSGGGAISFVGNSRYGNAGQFPTNLDSSPYHYAAGTFAFTSGSATPVATFTDPGGTNSTASYSATINWGDNSPGSSGQVTQAQNTFTVSGNHTYAEEGSYTVTTTINHGGVTTTITSTATVTDQQLTTLASANLPASGQEGTGTGAITGIATFTDSAGIGVEPTSDFTATINWGDNKTSSGTVVSLGGGNYRVDAPSHTYAEPGTYTVNVTLKHDALAALTTPNQTIVVGDAPLSATGTNVSPPPTEGVSFTAQVATFTDANPSAPVSDFPSANVLITWGNNSTSQGTVTQPNGPGTAFVVTGTHTYTEPNPSSFAVTVSITDVDGATASAAATASVGDGALMAAGTSVSAQEGTPFTAQVATFTDVNPSAPVSDFPSANVVINWGDNSTSPGTVTQPNGPGTAFVVSGTHTYAEESTHAPDQVSYGISVTITDTDGDSANAGTTASVSDPPVGATGVNLTGIEGVSSGAQAVATFTDPAGAEAVGDYSATINWGDGTPGNPDLTTGLIALSGTTFTVSGSHIYAEEGSYTVTTTINHETAVPPQTVTGTATVTSAGLLADPTNPALTDLYVADADASDTFQLSPAANGGLSVSVAEGAGGALQSLGTFAPTGHVIVLPGGGGHLTIVSTSPSDSITVTSNAVTINGQTVSSSGISNLTVQGNAIVGDSAGDPVSGLSTLTVTGTTTINASSVSTTGAQSYGGAVTLGTNTTLTGTTVTAQSTVTGGGFILAVSGNAVFDGEATGMGGLSVSGTTAINTDAVSSSGSQTYSGGVTLGSSTTLKATATGGNVTFASTVDGNHRLEVDAGGTISFDGLVGATTPVNQLVTGATGTTVIGASVQTGATMALSGDATFNNPVILTANVTLTDTGTGIFFKSTVDSDSLQTPRSLTVDATATTLFGGAVGLQDPLASLTVVAEPSGTTQVNGGSVTTTGAQTYNNDAVTLGADTTLTSTGGGSVSFSNTVDGAHALAVNTAGVTTFGGAVGGTTALTSVTTDAAGSTALNGGSVTTTGAQSYSAAVTLGAAAALSGTSIGFGSSVTGAYDLTDTGATTFGGAVSTKSVTDSGTTAINGGSVSTTAAQSYIAAVTLGAAAALSGTSISFGSSVSGAYDLTDTGATTFGGAVSTKSVTDNGTTAINGGSVSTTAAQSYTAAVTLGAAAALSGTSISFTSSVSGSYDLTDTGATTFGGAVSTKSVTDNGTTAINGGSVTTTAAQSYTGAVTLGAAAALSGTSISFTSSVSGSYDLTDTGATTFGGTVSTKSVTDNGTTAINGGSVSTTAAQSYSAAVTLGATAALSGTSISFGSTVSGAYDLTDTGATTFGGTVSTKSVTDNGATAINGGSVTTTAAQSYSSAVTLGAAAALSGTSISFTSSVSGSYDLTDTGATTFGGTVSTKSVTDNGTTAINGGSVSTTAAQSYSAAVTLGAAAALSGTSIGFSSSVSGAYDLTDTGATTFGGAVSTKSVTDNGTTAINGGSVSTTAAQSYTAAVTLGAAAALSGTSISFGSSVSGAYDLTDTGATTFGGAVSTKSVTDNGTTAINGGSVSTTAAQSYIAAVTLGAAAALSGTSISFGSTVSGAYDLTDTGATTFGGAVSTKSVTDNGTTAINGGSVTTTAAQSYTGAVTLGAAAALSGTSIGFGGSVSGSYDLTDTGATTFGGTVSTKSVTDNGTTAINGGSVSTTAAQSYSAAVTLGATAALSGTSISFGSTVSGAYDLTDTGATTFGGAVSTKSVTDNGTTAINGGSVTTTAAQSYSGAVTLGAAAALSGTSIGFSSSVSGAYDLTDTGATTFGGTVSTKSVTDNGATAINGGSVTTTAAQSYTGAVTLGAAAALSGTSISFTSSVSGSYDLTDTGATTFGGTVSTKSVTDNGTTAINGGSVSTTAAQSYSAAVTLGATAALSGTSISFGSTVSGAYDLTDTGATTFGGTVSTKSVTDNGATAINGGSVTTTAAQSYSSAVTLGAAAALSGTSISFTSSVSGSYDLTDTGATTFGGTVSTKSVTDNGTTAINGGSVSTTAAQSYIAAVTLGAAAALSGTSISFGSTVSGAYDLTDTGATTFGGAVSTKSVTDNGTTAINGGSVSTTAAQSYTAAVTLGAAAALSGTSISFGSSVSGAYDLTDTGATTFGGAVSTKSVTDNGTTAINGGSVTTTGAQTYNDAVSLGAATTLQASAATFNAPVAGGGNSLAITGNAVFGNHPTDTVTGLSTLSVSASSTINTTNITTTGTQTYGGAVTLGTGTTLAGSGVTFNGTVDGAQALAVSGPTAFNANVGSATALSSLAVTGATTINAAGITTSGAQTYNSAVSLTHATALGGSAITFQSTVDGAQALTVSGTTTFNGNVGSGTALSSLAVTGAISINAVAITTTGDQAYNGAVTLLRNTALTSSGTGNITLGGTVDGAQTLTLTAGGNVSFVGAVGAGTRLGAVTIVTAANVTESAGLKAVSLTQNAGTGTTTWNGVVDTNGPAGVALTGNNIAVNNAIQTSNGGPVIFTNAGQLSSAASGTISATGAVTQNGTGPVSTAGNITTTGGAITFATAVTLTGPVTLTSNGGAVGFNGAIVGGTGTDLTVNAGAGNVTFSSTIDGAFTLTVNSGGTTRFNGDVGDVTPLVRVVTGAAGTTVLVGSMHTSGDLTFNDPVYLAADLTLTDAGLNSTGITFNSTVDSIDDAHPHALTAQSSRSKTFNASIGGQHALASLATQGADAVHPTVLNAGSVTTTGDQQYDTIQLRQQTAWNVGGSTQFNGTITAPPGQNFALNVKGTANTKTIDLSTAQVPVTLEIPTTSSTTKPVLKGGQDKNTFIKTKDEHVDETLVGGGVGSTNLYNVVPDSAVTVVSNGGDNTLDLSNAQIAFVSKSTGTVMGIGITLDMTQTNGTAQPVYQNQQSNPDIGALVDPSLLTTNNNATLALQGNFQKVVVGSNSLLFAAPATYGPTGSLPGTTVVLTGTNNTVYGAPGATITGDAGGNTVIQNPNAAQPDLNAVINSGAQSAVLSSAALNALLSSSGLNATLTGGGLNALLSSGGVNAVLSGGGLNALLGTGGLNALLGTGGLNALLSGGGLNALLSGGGLNALLGNGGLNALLGNGGLNALLGSSGLNALLSGGGLNALLGSGGLNALLSGGGLNALLTGGGLNALLGPGGLNATLSGGGLNALLGSGGLNALLSGGGLNALLSGGGLNALLSGGGLNALLSGGGLNSLIGGGGLNSLLTGGGLNALLTGGGLNALIGGGGLNALLTSGGLNALLTGGGLNALLSGGGLNALLSGGGLNALLSGGGLNALLSGGGLNALLGNGGLNALLSGGGLNALLTGGGLNALLGSGGLNALLTGGGLNALLTGGGLNALLTGGGLNALLGSGGLNALLTNGGLNALLTGGGLNALLSGGGLNALLTGGGLNALLTGGGLNALISGGGLNALLGGGGLNALLSGGGLNALLSGGGLNALLSGGGLNALVSSGGLNALVSGGGLNALIGGGGLNALLGSGGLNALLGSGGLNALLSGGGFNALLSSGGLNAFLSGGGLNALLGGGGLNALLGGSGLNALISGGGLNALLGGGGLNALISGGGLNALLSGGGLNALISGGGLNALLTGGGLNALLGTGGLNALLSGGGLNALLGTGGLNALLNSSGLNALLGTGGLNALLSSGGFNSLLTSGGLNALLGTGGLNALLSGGGLNALLSNGGLNSLLASGGLNAVLATVTTDVALAAATANVALAAATADVALTAAIADVVLTTALVDVVAATALINALLTLPAVQTALLNIPEIQAALLSTQSVFEAIMTDPSLQAQAKTNPLPLATLFNNQTVQAQLANPAEQNFVQAQVQANNPLVVQSLFVGNPANVSNPLARQILTAAAAGKVAMNVSLVGSGNQATGGLFSNFALGPGALFTENITAAQLAVLNQAIANGATDLTPFLGTVSAAGGNNVFVGGLGGQFTAQGGGSNRFVIEDPSLLGVPSANVPQALYQYGGSFTGTGGGDSFYFVGGGAGNNFGSVALNESPASGAANGAQTLDFSNFQGGGLNLDLSKLATPQAVTSGLSLTLPSLGVTNVIGSPASDIITGNSLNNTLSGAAVKSNHPGELPAVAPASVPTQWIYLDFTDYVTPPALTYVDPTSKNTVQFSESLHKNSDGVTPNGAYSHADQQAILAGLQKIYAPFGFVQFTLTKPTAAQAPGGYETVDFNLTPVGDNGVPFSGGQSDEIDFRNLNVNNVTKVDVNGVLGVGVGQVPDTGSNWVNLSVTVAAHEAAGHALGLRHEEAFGPIGFGISNPPGPKAYIPTYPGLVGAFTTNQHIITSPAAVGSTLLDAANGKAYLGERESVKLAFVTGGTVVDGTNPNMTGQTKTTDDGPYQVSAAAAQPIAVSVVTEGQLQNGPAAGTSQTVSAQPVSLYTLNVPNAIPAGLYSSDKTFDVAAVDVLGHFSGAHPDYYTFTGQVGDLMNFQVLSNGLTRLVNAKNWIDPVVYVYGPNGQLVTWNDDQFEGPDSSVVDLTLPATGTYTVEVDSYQDATGQTAKVVPGDYELFLYRFAAYNATSGNDTLIGRGGDVTFQGGNSINIIQGGTGKNTVIASGDANFSLSSTKITVGQATDTLTNVQNAIVIGGNSNNTYTIDPSWTGGLTLFTAGGSDTLQATGQLAASSTTVRGDLAQANISGDLLGPLTVWGTLGNLTVGGSQGIGVPVTAAAISGSIIASSGPITSTIQTTGTQINPLTGVPSPVPVSGDIGTVTTNSSGQVSIGTVVSSNGAFTGKLLSAGSIYEAITVNGGFTGTIAAANNIGAAQTDSKGNVVVNANGQVSLAGSITINGGDSGAFKAGGNVYAPVTLNGGLSGQISYSTSNGVTTGTPSGGEIVVVGNLVSALTVNGGLSGLLAVGGDIGAIQLTSTGTAVMTGTTAALTRYGGVTVNGGLSGQIVVLGNDFANLQINGGLSGRIAVKGRQEYGLQFGSTNSTYTSAAAAGATRTGLLGSVSINGGIASTGGIVSGGLIGDDGHDAISIDGQGTQLSDNGGDQGLLAAEEDINFGSVNGNTKGSATFENTAVLDATSKAAIDAIFTNGNTALAFDLSSQSLGGLGLILGDLANLKVGANGKLTGTVA